MNDKEFITETPAQGILKINDYGDSKWYYVICDCANPDCAHAVEVEADDDAVVVHVYTTAKTTFWSKTRWRQIWQILTQGYAEMETSVVLQEQQALNYAKTLTDAVNDVKMFKEKERRIRK
jgi:hypothetical protein